MIIRYVMIAACVTGLSVPALYAQENPAPWTPPMQDSPKSESEPDSLEEGLNGLMDNLMRELAPELDRLGEGMSGALSGMGPVLQNLATLGQDLENYQAPERLENGDILIRRKPGAPPPPPFGDDLSSDGSPDNPPEDADRFKRIPDVIPRDPNQPEYEL